MASAIRREAMLWSVPVGARPGGNLLVILHGATSNERDPYERLLPLLPDDLTVVSLRGPVAEDGGYSWVSPEDRANAVTDSEVAAVGNAIGQAVLGWFGTLPAYGSVGILGVSQGACVAFQAVRAAPSRFAYLINLSGYCLPGAEEGDRELQRTPLPVFWGRGEFDEVIPGKYIARTAAWLAGHSVLTERIYPMGHDLCPAELADVAAFVSTQLGA